MNRDTTVTLDQVHSAIVTRTALQFPGVHVEAYRDDRSELPVPCILVEMTEWEGDPECDPGTEQLAIRAMFEALVVMRPRGDGIVPKMEIRKLATAFAAFARLQRWGCPMGPAIVTGAHASDFEPDLDQFEVWRVEWQQDINIGESVWNAAGDMPAAILVSFVPLIGIGHEPDYIRLNDGPPTDAMNEQTVVLR